jgi:hypothetical protein
MFRRKLHISLVVIGLYGSDPRCWKEPGIPGTTVSTLEIASCNVISPDAVNLTDSRENGGSVNTFKFYLQLHVAIYITALLMNVQSATI